MKTIILYGHLREKFKQIHRLDVNSPAEAIRLMCANYPEFEKVLINSRAKNMGYSIVTGTKTVKCECKGKGKNELSEKLNKPTGCDIIKIIPRVIGAKRGLGQVFAGLAIVAASVFTFGAAAVGVGAGAGAMASAGMSAIAAGGLAGAIASMGAAVALGGIVQMISPNAKGLATQDSPFNRPSYNFNGPVNTTAQGGPVPTLDGRCEIGGAIISAGLYAQDQM